MALPYLASVLTFFSSAGLALEGEGADAAARSPAGAIELPTIEVIASTPLPALGAPVDKVPANVQSLSAEDVEEQNPLDLSELLFDNIGSVNINAAQNNPFQNDLEYRGFLASPLVGSAIGLSIYMDGVRINEGFGDTINWDLIPQSAISSVDLIPGSNPLYGLNTLGGAIALRTKSGFAFQGTEVEASGGSFGRWAVEAEHGGYQGAFDWYLSFNALDEDGWRDESPSEIRQLFGKLGWEDDETDIDLSYVFAQNALTGNGFAPERLLAEERDAVYTFPDDTDNHLNFLNLRASHAFTDALLLAGNAYYRGYRRETLNGDAELACVDEDDSAIALAIGSCEGSAAPFGGVGALDLAVEGEDRTTETDTDGYGGTLQLSHRAELFGRANSMTFGFAYDGNDTGFTQAEAEGEIFQKGLARGIRRSGTLETEVDVATRQDNWGIFLTDTFEITEALALNFSGRYQITEVEIRDQTGDPENADLDGDHRFDRFNPAGGLTYSISEDLNLFGGYSESFRAPTPAELSCADPNDPCNLPNAFLADPPLDAVIGRTWELGARGQLALGEDLRWHAAFYRTMLDDDLVFAVTETAGAGFFTNIDETRRQGVELGLGGEWEAVRWSVDYGFVEATYGSDETLASVVEPDGIQVQEGDRIPGIPEHNLKAGADWAILPKWSVGATLIYASDQFLRGDDGNQLDPVDDYAIVNLRTRFEPWEHLEVWARIDNLFDRDYETGGTRNFDAFADPIAEARFLAPGAPRAGWVGVKLRF